MNIRSGMDIYVYEKFTNKMGFKEQRRYTFKRYMPNVLEEIYKFIDDCKEKPLDDCTDFSYQITTTYKEGF